MLVHGSGKSGLAILDLIADEKDQYTAKPLRRMPLIWKALTKNQIDNTLCAALYQHGEAISAEKTALKGQDFLAICQKLDIKVIVTIGGAVLRAVSQVHGKSTKLIGATIQSPNLPTIIPIDTARGGIRALRAYAWQLAMGGFIRRGLDLARGRGPLFTFPSIITGEGDDVVRGLERILDEKLPTGNDVETSGRDFRTDRLTAMALSNRNIAVSVPWDAYTSRMYGHQQGLQSEKVRRLVNAILGHEGITKLFHNGMFDLSVLATKGVRVSGPTEDTMLAHKIVYPDLFHNLQFCMANEFCIDPWKTRFEQLRVARGEPLDNWEDTDPGPLFLYNAQDAAAEAPLWERLSTLLDGVHRGWENYGRLKRIAEGAAEMQYHGVGIDLAAAAGTKNTALARINEIEKRWAGFNFSTPVKELAFNKATTRLLERQNIKRISIEMSGEGSAQLIPHLFFKQLGAPVLHRSQATDEPGIASHVLLDYAWMKDEKPILAEAAFTLFEYRKIKKSYDAFLKDLTTDRVYAKPQVAGTRGTRFSYAEPNLQQWAKEKEIVNPITGLMVRLSDNLRHIIVPDKGMVMGEHDYNALELREVAFASNCLEWLAWLDDPTQDMHLNHVKLMFNREVKKSDPLRQIVKTLTYARFYNSRKTVKQVLRMLKASMPTLNEARLKMIFEAFDKARPEIVAWQRKVEDGLRKGGFVELPLSGVRQYHDRDFPDTNAGLSFGIQSTGGDIINNAFLRILPRLDASQGERILINVHDALIWQAPRSTYERVAAIITEEMERPVSMWGHENIIYKTECKVGYNWRDLMKPSKFKELLNGKV